MIVMVSREGSVVGGRWVCGSVGLVSCSGWLVGWLGICGWMDGLAGGRSGGRAGLGEGVLVATAVVDTEIGEACESANDWQQPFAK